MDPARTALVLIGYQNDYFASDGILHGVFEDPDWVRQVKDNTLELLAALKGTPVSVFSTPICFTPDYSELDDPVGILKTIKEVGAFQAGQNGSETIPEFAAYADTIQEVPGKRGLNAFSNTELAERFRERGIEDVVIAGAVTTVCVDSTARAATEMGYRVTILGDCTLARERFEQDFYCEKIFPIYARVLDRHQLLQELGMEQAA